MSPSLKIADVSSRFYSILADESSDVSKTEQLSFSVRTCDDSYKVSEDFIGIYECSQGLSSDALLHYTKDILHGWRKYGSYEF